MAFLKIKSKKKTNDDNISFASSQLGAHASRYQAQATDEAIKGMGMLREMARRLVNVGTEKKQGNLFEIIEATKFNMDAASKGLDNIRAGVTALEGNPHAAADIIIRDGDKIVREVQTKSTNSAVSATRMFREAKYNGMQKVTNPEHIDTVKRIAGKRADMNGLFSDEHRDTVQNIRGGLELDGSVHTKGTTHTEAIKAAEHSRRYAAGFEVTQVGKEMLYTGANAAAAGGIIGAAISIAKNGIEVSRGMKSVNEATKEVMKDAGKSGAKSGAIGFIGAGIRSGASKMGVQALTKSNVATSIAAGVVDSGITLLRYVKGEISGAEVAEKIGGTGITTVSSIYAGAAAGAVFGPAGALIGSIAGYMVSSGVYQSAMAILKDAKLSEIEADRITALCIDAEEEMRKQREMFETMIAERLTNNRREFKQCFKEMDKGLENGRFVDTVLALEKFNLVFGHSLKLESFADFDRHLKNNKSLEL
ncbi:hypothetical protein HZF08_01840 [Paenibacillus sp. CGMCC 1.16610]|uniref:Uncharacterized protein n=1 Tax=Paenibacillus anseongense TaxID=2682845 RepID=A0ABW9U2E3_9BACL|nr:MULTISPECIES: hypothetical protein [Paenibacillus]MBA2937042.1 hypothetical protein [Paenibacillus sp. CGMCC 1.16610]MVQ33365.1 hypothetical protein [Paenibacillus anseongense]